MADISQELDQLRNAVYGEEVRRSFYLLYAENP